MLYRILVLGIVIGLLSACGGNKKNLKNGDELTVDEFLSLYPKIALPFSYSDSSFPAKEADTSVIDSGVFYKFTSGSFITSVFDSTANPGFYPVGKFDGTEEGYLLTRGITRNKKALFITAYNSKKEFITGIPIIIIDVGSPISTMISIDSKFNIKKDVRSKKENGDIVEGHEVYILNNAIKKFMLIMTDSLGGAATELINPIDTLPKKQKYSGDYGDGKLNLISIRDGQREGRLHFFLQLEQKNTDCKGELKGEATFISANVAEYRQGGDPCVLQFIFKNNTVEINEIQGCGSRMGGLQCTFNGTYAKKKAPKMAEDKRHKQT